MGATTHLKLVAKQKSDAAKELEQVYQSLSDLEEELEASRRENELLRNKTSSTSSPRSLRSRRRVPPRSINTESSLIGKSHVRVTRSGSVVIEPAQNPSNSYTNRYQYQSKS